MRPRITTAGLAALTGALNGTGIVFTKMKMGNGANPGSYLDLTDLVNTVVTIPITGLDLTPNDSEGYVELTGSFSNGDIQASFDWTEVGIFIQDPEDNTKDILYAYGHVKLESGYESAAAIPAAGTEVYEIELVYRVYVGEAEDISAQIAEYSIYPTKAEFSEHVNNFNNPHKVTAQMLGLENVPNVSTNDQTPTFNTPATMQEIESGETLSTIMGKVKKAVSTLIEHINDTVKHVSKTDRTNWNGKADTRHTHSVTDINSGTLSVERGGTGSGTPKEAANNVLNQGADRIGGKMIFSPAPYDNILGGDVSDEYRWRVGGGPIGTLGSEDVFPGSVTGYTFFDSSFPTVGHQEIHMPIVVRQYHPVSAADAERLGKDEWEKSWGYVNTLAFLLDHSGNTRFPGSVSANSQTLASDRKLKENITEIKPEEAMNLVMGLNPVSYSWKSDDTHRGRMGFIAQEVYKTVHDLGIENAGIYNADMTPKDADDIFAKTCLSDYEIESHDDAELKWSLDYQQIIAPMIKVIQEQEKRIRQLETLIKE